MYSWLAHCSKFVTSVCVHSNKGRSSRVQSSIGWSIDCMLTGQRDGSWLNSISCSDRPLVKVCALESSTNTLPSLLPSKFFVGHPGCHFLQQASLPLHFSPVASICLLCIYIASQTTYAVCSPVSLISTRLCESWLCLSCSPLFFRHLAHWLALNRQTDLFEVLDFWMDRQVDRWMDGWHCVAKNCFSVPAQFWRFSFSLYFLPLFEGPFFASNFVLVQRKAPSKSR